MLDPLKHFTKIVGPLAWNPLGRFGACAAACCEAIKACWQMKTHVPCMTVTIEGSNFLTRDGGSINKTLKVYPLMGGGSVGGRYAVKEWFGVYTGCQESPPDMRSCFTVWIRCEGLCDYQSDKNLRENKANLFLYIGPTYLARGAKLWRPWLDDDEWGYQYECTWRYYVGQEPTTQTINTLWLPVFVGHKAWPADNGASFFADDEIVLDGWGGVGGGESTQPQWGPWSGTATLTPSYSDCYDQIPPVDFEHWGANINPAYPTLSWYHPTIWRVGGDLMWPDPAPPTGWWFVGGGVARGMTYVAEHSHHGGQCPGCAPPYITLDVPEGVTTHSLGMDLDLDDLDLSGSHKLCRYPHGYAGTIGGGDHVVTLTAQSIPRNQTGIGLDTALNHPFDGAYWAWHGEFISNWRRHTYYWFPGWADPYWGLLTPWHGVYGNFFPWYLYGAYGTIARYWVEAGLIDPEGVLTNNCVDEFEATIQLWDAVGGEPGDLVTMTGTPHEDCGTTTEGCSFTQDIVPIPTDPPTDLDTCLMCKAEDPEEFFSPLAWDVTISGSSVSTADGVDINGTYRVCHDRDPNSGSQIGCRWRGYVSCREKPGTAFLVELEHDLYYPFGGSAYWVNVLDNDGEVLARFDATGDWGDCSTMPAATDGEGTAAPVAVWDLEECDCNPDDYVWGPNSGLLAQGQEYHYLSHQYFHYHGHETTCAGAEPTQLLLTFADFLQNAGACIGPAAEMLDGLFALDKVTNPTSTLDALMVTGCYYHYPTHDDAPGSIGGQAAVFLYASVWEEDEEGEPPDEDPEPGPPEDPPSPYKRWALLATLGREQATSPEVKLNVSMLVLTTDGWQTLWFVARGLGTRSCMNIDETFDAGDVDPNPTAGDPCAVWAEEDAEAEPPVVGATLRVQSSTECWCSDDEEDEE